MDSELAARGVLLKKRGDEPMTALPHFAARAGSLSRKAITALMQFLLPSLYEPDRRYHPEEHYMRGPGPKWRAKHDLTLKDAQPLREHGDRLR